MLTKGFTKLEVLITVLVFAFLLGCTVPRVMHLVHKAKEGSTKHRLVKMRSAIAAITGNTRALIRRMIYPAWCLNILKVSPW